MNTEIEVYSGARVDVTKPDPTAPALSLLNISHALGNICRYNGHAAKFYSVAEHCVLGSYLFPEVSGFARAFMMHDAVESIMGDIPRPMKSLVPEHQKLEQQWLDAIYLCYGIRRRAGIMDRVNYVDDVMLVNEARILVHSKGESWGIWDKVKDIHEKVDIHCWDPRTATVNYRKRWHELNEEKI